MQQGRGHGTPGDCWLDAAAQAIIKSSLLSN